MADSIQRSDSIDSSGFPLGFKVRQGVSRSPLVDGRAATDVFNVELRAMGGHEKEAVVTEGSAGSVFRAVSDEGPGLNGTDLAPNPLSFFSAALPADIMSRFMQIARSRQVEVQGLSSTQVNAYGFVGSFMKGDGKGSAEAPVVRLRVRSGAPADRLQAIARAAMDASPLVAMCRATLDNTFALYANGRRRTFASPTPSNSPDARDPLKAWKGVPAPLDASKDLPGMVSRLGSAPVAAAPASAPTDPGASVRRRIEITGKTLWNDGLTESEIRGAGSLFGFRSDERSGSDAAPCALSIGAWGVAFCLTTQFLRYADFHKMNIRAVRIVQSSPFELTGDLKEGTLRAVAHPMDTHVFLHGEESDERMEKLLVMAQNTCYLHALLATPLEPVLELEVEGATTVR